MVANTREVKYLDAEGQEVEEKDAVMALVSEYDKDGNLIAEHFGVVESVDTDEQGE